MSPLKGVRIADFTIHAAGPFCTHLLSQLGAECVKIESLTRLDAFRKPHAVYGRMEAATFDQVSANKLSVRLNLKTEEGILLAKQLVGISTVTAQSFRPGVMRRLGLDFESLRKIKADLVMLSLSASGQSGPDSHFAGYAPLFGAWGGLGTMSGYDDGPPVEMRHVMDHSAGLHAALAVMAALHQWQRTGAAQHVDLAAREVASAMIGDALVQASLGEPVVRPGNGHLTMAPHGVYATASRDRWLTLAIRTDEQWQAFLRVLGRPDFMQDPRFLTALGRRRHAAVLDGLVGDWILGVDADMTVTALQRNGVAAHVSWNTQDIVDDVHLRQRELIVAIETGPGQQRAAIGLPARFSKATDVGLRSGTPVLGQDEDYVYGELLGLSRDRRRDLEQRQIIY